MDGGLIALERIAGAPQLQARSTPATGMPPQRPRDMPVQVVSRRTATPPPAAPGAEARFLWRRVVVLGSALLLAAAAIYQMGAVLEIGGLTPIEVVLLSLFSVTFAWVGLTLTTAFAGLIVRMARGPATFSGVPLKGRTAAVMPAYNEEPARVFAAIEAMAREVVAAGGGDAFDWFVLSDTTDPEIALREQAAFGEIRSRLGDHARVYYRRRRRNVARKPGNIADFCKRWGGAYDYLLVLDADSVMEGATVVELARRLEADPRAGIVQTVPRLVGGRTLFARLQQFAGHAYGPSIAAGLAWWTGTEGNYWGHNAIIRMAAFAGAAGLPTLAGRPPFGGHILSHDFVEAALIRRAGWTVVIADDLGGSYEEGPPTIADMAVRDRRWCQGNLQHARLIAAPGFHWVSRFHLFTGIMSYASSPLWLMLIVAGLALGVQAYFTEPDYFPGDFNLFPAWPVIDPLKALSLFAMTMAVLLAVKLIGLIDLALATRQNGRAGRPAPSVVLELLFSALLAPILMVIQTGLVVSILSGSDRGWRPQRRDAERVSWVGLGRDHRWHMATGVGLGLAAWLVSPSLFYWLAPALVGLLLAVPVAAACGSARLGAALRRRGLLVIPEELAPPRAVKLAADLRPAYEEALKRSPDLRRIAVDSSLRSSHLALVESVTDRKRGEVDPAEALALAKIGEARSVAEALSWLDREERAAVIGAPHILERLARLPAS